MATPSTTTPSTTTPSTYPQTLLTVAISQICLTVGYTGSHTSALRALTDIAGRYIRLLATTAASSAATAGRTQSNIIDLIFALEFAAGNRGFAGAGDVNRTILRSSVVRELRGFVLAIDEIPFPRPIRRLRESDGERKLTRSFEQAGREPRMRHVPRWLPCFPEGYGNEGDCNGGENMEEEKEMVVMEVRGRDMVRERGRVRFKLGFGGEKKKLGIRKFFNFREEEVEEIGDLKNDICRRRVSNPDDFCKNYVEIVVNASPASPVDLK